jgi:hypothetical protein
MFALCIIVTCEEVLRNVTVVHGSAVLQLSLHIFTSWSLSSHIISLLFISMSMLVDMPPCFWCSSSCFHFALCLKVCVSLHIVCGCMIEERIWYQWGRSNFVYCIIDWWQTSTLIYWRLFKQWNSIHCRQFWKAIFVDGGEEVTNNRDSCVVHMKQYAVFQSKICCLNSWKGVIRNTTWYCNLYKSDSF